MLSRISLPAFSAVIRHTGIANNKQIPSLFLRKMHLLKQEAYVNGAWIEGTKTFDVFNPANGDVLAKIPDLSVQNVNEAVEAASAAFEKWSNTTAKERSDKLRAWYELLTKHSEEIAKIMTLESGKPLIESRGEVKYGNSFLEWFAEEARRIRGETIPSPIPGKRVIIEKEPIGPVALITPWNFPHAMITRKAGAALAAGCTCVVKPAEDTPLTALAIAHLAHEAGIPKGVFNVVTTSRENAPEVGTLLCRSPLISGISFTGSTEVGKILYGLCADGIKRIALELGGNAPFIVFDSASVNDAVKGAVASKFRNCGQTCVASNRFFIQNRVYDRFVDEFVDAIKEIKMGNGMDECVTAGPLVNKSQLNIVSELVQDALDKGAKALVGGKQAEDLGELFYEPTLLVDVTPEMRIYKEEIFGPVAPIIRFNKEEEAVAIANNTNRGLAGYFYSQDVKQIFRVSRQLQVGMIGINEGIISMAEVPFGGVKQSGIGREGSHQGIDEYINIKYICIGNL